MSSTTSEGLWDKLSEREYRSHFAALQLKRGVPFQIRAILKKRGWTQEQLAEQAHLTQGVISRAQDPDYGNLTINTISRIASGFDVAFVGQFVPFSRLVDWFENLSEDYGDIASFNQEHVRVKRRSGTNVVRKRGRRKRDARHILSSVPINQTTATTTASGTREYVNKIQGECAQMRLPFDVLEWPKQSGGADLNRLATASVGADASTGTWGNYGNR